MPIQPIWSIFSVILIFSIAMGADYSFELISIETYICPQFIGHNKIFLCSVKTIDPIKHFLSKLGWLDFWVSWVKNHMTLIFKIDFLSQNLLATICILLALQDCASKVRSCLWILQKLEVMRLISECFSILDTSKKYVHTIYPIFGGWKN